MIRSQLEHAIRASCDVLKIDEVTILGSQSILGKWNERQLPPKAIFSKEVDVADFTKATLIDQEKSADLLEGLLGEYSRFHQTHGFYIDGVDSSTASLPPGWNKRLVKVQNRNTNNKIGWCLEPHDLCVAKLAANREKDREFVTAVMKADIVKPKIIRQRLEQVPENKFMTGKYGKSASLAYADSLIESAKRRW